MFSSLQQGSLIYILDKTEFPKLKIGEVVSVSAPRTNNFLHNNFGSNTCVDIKVNIDGSVYDYNSIPSSYSIVSYNNGKITLSETKQGLQTEVETIISNSKQVLSNIDTYKKNISEGEKILKELNPSFAKDKERDDRLSNLEEKFEGVETKIDKILTALTNKEK